MSHVNGIPVTAIIWQPTVKASNITRLTYIIIMCADIAFKSNIQLFQSQHKICDNFASNYSIIRHQHKNAVNTTWEKIHCFKLYTSKMIKKKMAKRELGK